MVMFVSSQIGFKVGLRHNKEIRISKIRKNDTPK